MNERKGYEWWVLYTASDAPPVFREQPKGTPPDEAGHYHGPFGALSEARVCFERMLMDDINTMRRSLAAMRRGEYILSEAAE